MQGQDWQGCTMSGKVGGLSYFKLVSSENPENSTRVSFDIRTIINYFRMAFEKHTISKVTNNTETFVHTSIRSEADQLVFKRFIVGYIQRGFPAHKKVRVKYSYTIINKRNGYI